MSDCRLGIYWWMDVLTTYAQDWNYKQLQLYRWSPQHKLSLFPACCVFISLSLATASNNGDSSASRSQVLSSQRPVQISTPNWLQPTDPSQAGGHFITTHRVFSSQPDFQLSTNWVKVKVKVKVKITLRLTVSQSVSLWGSWPDIYYCLTVTGLFLCGALSDERTSLSFVYAAGPCQRSLYRVRVPWDSPPYFTVSDLRLLFSSPPTTRRVKVGIFNRASTRPNCLQGNSSARTTQKTPMFLL
jgi:hypothetical protein